jgi:hypothetical protein
MEPRIHRSLCGQSARGLVQIAGDEGPTASVLTAGTVARAELKVGTITMAAASLSERTIDVPTRLIRLRIGTATLPAHPRPCTRKRDQKKWTKLRSRGSMSLGMIGAV